MVAADVTLEYLDIDISEGLTCDVVFRHAITKNAINCTRPAVVRVHIHCNTCHHEKYLFLCAPCWADARAGDLNCYYCFAANRPRMNDCTFRES